MKRALFTALLLALTLPAAAQPYLIGGISPAHKSSLSAPMVGVGWLAGRFAVELAAFDLGEIKSESSAPAAAMSFRTQDARGARLSLLGSIPLSPSFSLVGSVSAYRIKSKVQQWDTFTSGGVTTITSASSSSPAVTVPGVGLGAAYSLNERVSLRGMLEYVDGKDDLDSLRLFSLAAVISF
jgi:hypothetical protein